MVILLMFIRFYQHAVTLNLDMSEARYATHTPYIRRAEPKNGGFLGAEMGVAHKVRLPNDSVQLVQQYISYI